MTDAELWGATCAAGAAKLALRRASREPVHYYDHRTGRSVVRELAPLNARIDAIGAEAERRRFGR